MKRVHLSFDLNYSEMFNIYFSGKMLRLFVIYNITTTRVQFTKRKIKRQLKDRCYRVLLKPILAHYGTVQQSPSSIYCKYLFSKRERGRNERVPRRSIDYVLIEGSLRQGGDRYIWRRRGSVSSTISRPSCIAVYGVVMHIMGGMCTCRGSQLFDTAVGRFAIYAAAISRTHRA